MNTEPTVRKRAFLVIGPESSGTHLVTDILVHAGCVGDAGAHVDWKPDARTLGSGDDKPWERDLPTDVQPWDTALPTTENPVVWRRSVPHLGEWLDLATLTGKLTQRGYDCTVVVVLRDFHPTVQSRIKWRHSVTCAEAEERTKQATTQIFSEITRCTVPWTIVVYEALLAYPEAQDRLLHRLGLPLPDNRLPVFDADRKWYDAPAVEPPPAGAAGLLSAFDESRFPCDPSRTVDYLDTVQRGRLRMRRSTIVICGLAHNVRSSLPGVIARWERLGSMFHDYRIVVYENASTDDTRAVLMDCARTNSRVSVLSDDAIRPRWRSARSRVRMRYMARCRNRYLEHVGSTCPLFDYAAVADMDLPRGFSFEGIAHTFGCDGWDVMGSNGLLFLPDSTSGRFIYYDAWAFRDRGGQGGADFDKTNRMLFSRGEPIVPVDSSFGGLAFYRMAAFRCGAEYAGNECEHVGFHRAVQRKGYHRHFFNPSQIVLYGEDRDPYTCFMILSSPRSGTHMLRSALNTHPAIVAHSEMFNPDFIVHECYEDDVSDDEILTRHVFCTYQPTVEAVGFVLHRGEARFGGWPDLWDKLEADIRLKIVWLYRQNPLHRYISHQNMRARNRRMDEKREYSEQELRTEFRRYHAELDEFHRRFRFHEMISVTCEDLCDDWGSTLRRVQEFLGVEPLTLYPTSRKVRRDALTDYVRNFDTLSKAFDDGEWADFFR